MMRFNEFRTLKNRFSSVCRLLEATTSTPAAVSVTSTRTSSSISNSSSSSPMAITRFASASPLNKITDKYLIETTNAYQNVCLQCIRRFTSVMHKNSSFRREGLAIYRTLQRSNLLNPTDLSRIFGIGNLHLFGTSSNSNQQNQPRDDRDGKEDGKEDEKGGNKMPVLPRLFFMGWLAFAVYTTLRVMSGEDTSVYKFVSWNEFVHDMLAKGEVEEVIIRPEAEIAMIHLADGAVIKGRRSDFNLYTMKIPDPDKFEDRLRRVEAELGVKPERGVPISYQRDSNWAPFIILALLALGAMWMMKSFSKVSFPNPTDFFASERKAKFTRVDLQPQQGKGIKFKDVAGLKEAKIEIMEFVDYLKSPQRFKDLGAKVPHGALLLGPPGCGKTLLAKAVAAEAKVPFLAMAGSEFVEMIGGLGAARVRDLFKEARKRAPCIVYVDEIDAIGRKRGSANVGGSSEEEHTLNQLLVEMDGMGTTDGVIMLASTNRDDVLDKALLRPGRFDRHINIDLPTMEERKEIYEMYLKKLVLRDPIESLSPKLAQLSPGMSGADIANICNEAALHAARHHKADIGHDDFDYAVERVIAGMAKKSRVLSPNEKRVVAFHEAGHALVGWLLEHTDALLRISIVPRTNSALGFAQYMPSDKKLYSKEELFEKMCMALGGRVAESLTFNKITTGAQDDLKKVTKLAYDQVQKYGMCDAVGQVSYTMDEQGFGKKPFSKKLAFTMDEESRMLVARAYKSTEVILMRNKEKLKLLAEHLLEKEVLMYKDVEDLIGPPPFGPKKMITNPIPAAMMEPSTDATASASAKAKKSPK